MLAVVVAEGVAIALLAVLVLGLLRSHALILRALHELGAGLELEESAGTQGAAGPVPVDLQPAVVARARPESSRAPDLLGTALDGAVLSAPVGRGRTLVAFLTSGCSVCQSFWTVLSESVEVPGNARLVVCVKGPEQESTGEVRRLAAPGLPVLQSSAAWSDYQVPGSPYFVFVEDGTITGEGSATSWAAVRDLMAQAGVDQAEATAARSGSSAVGADGPDDATRIDRELHAAGIQPGHHSLYADPELDAQPIGHQPVGRTPEHQPLTTSPST